MSRFLTSRLLRLWPAIILCASVDAAIAKFNGMNFNDLGSHYIGALLVYGEGFDSAYWTLRVELIFYTLIVLMMLLSFRVRLTHFAGALCLLSFSYLTSIYISDAWPSAFPWHTALRNFDDGFRPASDFIKAGGQFAAGIMLWLGVRNGWSINRYAILVLSVTSACLQIALATEIIWRKTAILWPLSIVFMPTSIWLICLVAIGISLNFPVIDRSSLFRQVRWAGLATYSFYLLQNYAGASILGWLCRNGLQQYLALSISILLCAGTAFLITRYGEPRIRYWLHNTAIAIRTAITSALAV